MHKKTHRITKIFLPAKYSSILPAKYSSILHHKSSSNANNEIYSMLEDNKTF